MAESLPLKNLAKAWSNLEHLEKSTPAEKIRELLCGAFMNVWHSRVSSVGILFLGAPIVALLLFLALSLSRWLDMVSLVQNKPAMMLVFDSDESLEDARAAISEILPPQARIRALRQDDARKRAVDLFEIDETAIEAFEVANTSFPAILEIEHASLVELQALPDELTQRKLAAQSVVSNFSEVEEFEKKWTPFSAIGILATTFLFVALLSFLFAATRLSYIRRYRELFVHKLLGYKESEQKIVFMIEGALLGFIAAVLGVLLYALIVNLLPLNESGILWFREVKGLYFFMLSVGAACLLTLLFAVSSWLAVSFGTLSKQEM